jgi:hypothetical protein
MNKEQDHSESKHILKIFTLIEFTFGIFLILYGTQDILTFLESGIIMVVGIALIILLILYVAISTITEGRFDKPGNAKGFDTVLCICVLAMIFLVDIISEVGVASIVVICGIAFILLSVWHFKISLYEDDKSENQIDNV